MLKKLAHTGKGPLYQLIGRKAWYDTEDILAWLASRKQSGPGRRHPAEPAARSPSPNADVLVRTRRGRPTKTAQWRRAQARQSDQT